jgi:hypothetical protein
MASLVRFSQLHGDLLQGDGNIISVDERGRGHMGRAGRRQDGTEARRKQERKKEEIEQERKRERKQERSSRFYRRNVEMTSSGEDKVTVETKPCVLLANLLANEAARRRGGAG